MLPLVGLSPITPHTDAGMRSEPPPSLPCATGTKPAATAAAAPALEPPALCVGLQGVRVRPCSTVSVWVSSANSDVADRPRSCSPAPSRVRTN